MWDANLIRLLVVLIREVQKMAVTISELKGSADAALARMKADEATIAELRKPATGSVLTADDQAMVDQMKADMDAATAAPAA